MINILTDILSGNCSKGFIIFMAGYSVVAICMFITKLQIESLGG